MEQEQEEQVLKLWHALSISTGEPEKAVLSTLAIVLDASNHDSVAAMIFGLSFGMRLAMRYPTETTTLVERLSRRDLRGEPMELLEMEAEPFVEAFALLYHTLLKEVPVS